MYQSLDDFLELDIENDTPLRMILINEFENGGSFLTNYFITRFIKDEFGICLISTSQTNSHYANVANKNSVNLKKFQDDNLFLQFDFMQHFANKFLENVSFFVLNYSSLSFHNFISQIKHLTCKKLLSSLTNHVPIWKQRKR